MSDDLIFMFMVFITLILLCGCSAKNAQVTYKDVLIPVRCDIKMPLKPRNDGTLKATKHV